LFLRVPVLAANRAMQMKPHKQVRELAGGRPGEPVGSARRNKVHLPARREPALPAGGPAWNQDVDLIELFRRATLAISTTPIGANAIVRPTAHSRR